jgi:glycosyltransferase involved in cell wall biosynthesis
MESSLMRSLRIAVDARLMFDSPRRGIGKTAIALYQALAKIRPEWTFLLYYRVGRFPNPFTVQTNLHPQQLELPGYRLYGLLERWVNSWEVARLPWEQFRAKPDLLHLPGGLYPPFTVGKLVSTIHDLIPIDTRPDDADVKQWSKAVRRCAIQSKAILTASEHAKQRIIDVFKIPAHKIHIVQWGPVSVASQPLDPVSADKLQQKYQLPEHGRYALHFGLEDPRKNTVRLLEAWAGLPVLVRESMPLIVVGFQGPGLAKAQEYCAKLGVQDTVRLFSYIPEEDGQHLLARAALLCYPSLYEGYGLPMVEAFQAGVPVLASNHTSIPEVAGGAAYLVDATQVGELTQGLLQLLTDKKLRDDLAQRGREHAEPITWERCAQSVATVFEAVTLT